MKLINNRIRFFFYIFVFISVVLILNLVNLQIRNFYNLSLQAKRQFDWQLTIDPQRGEIFAFDKDNNKITLASNEIAYTLYLNPQEIQDANQIVNQLAKYISFDQNKILTKLEDKSLQYLIVQRYLTPSQENQVSNLKLKGVYFKEESKRIYPRDDLASQVLGFVGQDDSGSISGRYGVEAYFDDLLSGTPGFLSQNQGQTLRAPEDGADVVLTIDPSVQQRVEGDLAKGVQLNKADSGSAVVIDPKTGNIIALANYPTFNPNNFSKYKDYSVFQNLATQKYEPGSVMKAITLAGALNDNDLTPETKYDDKGYVISDGYKLNNYDNMAHGIITIRYGMAKSYNTVAMFAEGLMGHQAFSNYLQAFGFGKQTGITLPSESDGAISNLFSPRGRDVNYLTASYGQGIEATPIQLVQAFSAFANNGLMVRPKIVKEIDYPDGRIKNYFTQTFNEPISQQALARINSILINDVDLAGGSGHPAWLAHYTLAGKTGTAQIPNVGKPGYMGNDAYTQTFIGFGPASNPRFLMLVRMVYPKIPGLRFAETTVVPIFKDLAQFMISYYNIPPDR